MREEELEEGQKDICKYCGDLIIWSTAGDYGKAWRHDRSGWKICKLLGATAEPVDSGVARIKNEK